MLSSGKYPILDSDFHFKEAVRESRMVGEMEKADFSSDATSVWTCTPVVTYHERAMEALSWGRIGGLDSPGMVLDGSIVPACNYLVPTEDGTDFRCVPLVNPGD